MDDQSSRSFPQSQTDETDMQPQPQPAQMQTQAFQQHAPTSSVVHATIDESSREQSQHVSSGVHSRAYSQGVTRGHPEPQQVQTVSLQEHEYGSAEAMEYTPSNTSQNHSNSIPTHLITVSNSNLFLSATKHIQGASVTSPSPMLQSQINNQHQPPLDPNSETKVPLPSDLAALPQRRYSDNANTTHLPPSQFSSQNKTPASQEQTHGQSFGAKQNTLNQANNNLEPSSQQEMNDEDKFFDQHAHLLIQQQRLSQNSSNRQNQQNRNQNFIRINNFGAQNQMIQAQNLQSKQQPLNAPRHQNEPVLSSNQEVSLQSNGSYEGEPQIQPSSIPTPGFHPQNGLSGILSEDQMENQGFFGGNSNVHNFSVGQDSVNQPRVLIGSNGVTSSIVSSQRSQPQVRHQVISLVQQKQHLQSANQPNQQQVNFTLQKLQQKVREQAERLQQEANYRHLCEKRILQLEPTHSLPINASHLQMGVAQNQENKKPNQSDKSDNEEHLKQTVTDLQERIQQMGKQVNERDQLEARLRQTELSLRSETLQSEEQRAYIEMLKHQVEDKLASVGFVFEMDRQRDRSSSHHSNTHTNSCQAAQANNKSNASIGSLQRSGVGQNSQITRPIDGFLQLTVLKKRCDELAFENSQLKEKLEKSADNLGKALEEQRDEFLIKMEQLQEELRREQQQKKDLFEEKETLLDYAKDSMHKQKQAETLISKTQAEHTSNQDAMVELKKEVTAKDELLRQAKQNLEKVRAEAAKFKSEHELISAENTTLKLAKDEANQERNRVQNELRQELTKLEGLTDKLKTENREIQERYKVTQRETERSKFILKELEEHQHETRKRLSLETSKHVDALLQANNLKTTLVDSQQEMAELVSKYEQAVEDLLQRDAQINQQNTIIYDNQTQIANLNEEMRIKDEKVKSLNSELSDLYATLQRKNELLKQVEGRLQNKLNEKEEECFELHDKLNQLEHTFAQETQDLDHLKRICDDKISEGEKHSKLLRERDESLKDLKSELISVKLTHERTMKAKCDEIEGENDALKAEVGEKRIIIEELQKDLDELTQQLESGQKKIDQIEIESNQNAKKLKEAQEKATRWEEEVQRLESLQKRGEIAQESSQEHVERIRSQQIDDAMLIEKMREGQGQVKEKVNGIVGRISNFGANLEQMGQVALTRHLEQAYSEAKSISPATLEVQDVLSSIAKFVKHLTCEVIQSMQLAPVKDSLNENTLSHQKGNVDRTSSVRSAERIVTNQSVQNAYHDTDQRRSEIREFDSELKEKRMANSVKQLPVVECQNCLNQNTNLSAPEKNSLKNQILQLEEQQTLNQAWNTDLDTALRLCCQISSMENSIKLSLQELVQKIQSANILRRERARLAEKVTQMESSYHTRSRQTMTSATKDELVVLKSEIRDERYELHQLEIKIDSLERDKKKRIEDIKRTNAVLVDNSAEQALKVKNLSDLVDQLKMERSALTEQLEWKTHQFNEAKDLRSRFHPRQLPEHSNRDYSPDDQPKSAAVKMPSRASNESGSNGVTSHARLQTYVADNSNSNSNSLQADMVLASQRQFDAMSRKPTDPKLASPTQPNPNNASLTDLHRYDRASLKPLGPAHQQATPVYSSPTLQRGLAGNIDTTRINSRVPEVSSLGESQFSHQRGYSQAERDRDASLRRSLDNLSQASQLIRRKYSQTRVESKPDATQPAASLRARDPTNESLSKRQASPSANTAYQSYRQEMMRTAMPLRASPTRNVSLSPITDSRLTTGDLATAQFAFARH